LIRRVIFLTIQFSLFYSGPRPLHRLSLRVLTSLLVPTDSSLFLHGLFLGCPADTPLYPLIHRLRSSLSEVQACCSQNSTSQADLPDKFRITRHSSATPWPICHNFPQSPSIILPSMHYRIRAINRSSPPRRGSLWPQNSNYAPLHVLQTQGLRGTFAARSFREDFFPPVLMPCRRTQPWVLEQCPFATSSTKDVWQNHPTKIVLFLRTATLFLSISSFTVLKKEIAICASSQPRTLDAVTIQPRVYLALSDRSNTAHVILCRSLVSTSDMTSELS